MGHLELDQLVQTERNAWTDGAVDLVRRIDAKRRAINPNFIIVNNNIWARSDGSTRGLAAEKYVDGVSLEHPGGVNTYHARLRQARPSATSAIAACWSSRSSADRGESLGRREGRDARVPPGRARSTAIRRSRPMSFKALTDR